MAYSNIDKPTDHFNCKLYTGTGSSNSVDVGFQTDFSWIKDRDSTAYHYLYDTVRGAGKAIYSNDTAAEATNINNLASFDSSGFTVGTGGGVNASGNDFVSWNWKAGGSASSNSDGDITSSVSANQTAGFSIVTYTATSTATDTVGHGLGAKPGLIIIKERNGTNHWCVALPDTLGNNETLQLNLTNAIFAGSAAFNDTVNTGTTSSVFVSGNGGLTGTSGQNYVAYCFAEKQGYSKFGKYTGNGSTDGTFVYTGFKPSMVICKASSTTGDWKIFDNKRIGYNAANYRLQPNNSNAETSDNLIDILSNGFKLKTSSDSINGSGNTVIYMAFAESPLVGSNFVPTNAR